MKNDCDKNGLRLTLHFRKREHSRKQKEIVERNKKGNSTRREKKKKKKKRIHNACAHLVVSVCVGRVWHVTQA